MTKTKFDRLCLKCEDKLKELAPKDTGNLAFNAIRGEYIDENTYVISIDPAIEPIFIDKRGKITKDTMAIRLIK